MARFCRPRAEQEPARASLESILNHQLLQRAHRRHHPSMFKEALWQSIPSAVWKWMKMKQPDIPNMTAKTITSVQSAASRSLKKIQDNTSAKRTLTNLR